MAATSVRAVFGAVGTTGRTLPGNAYLNYFVLSGDASYPTGGYPMTAGTFGLTSLGRVIPHCWAGSPGATAGDFGLNPANGNLQFFGTNGSELAAGTNLSAVAVYLEAHGI